MKDKPKELSAMDLLKLFDEKELDKGACVLIKESTWKTAQNVPKNGRGSRSFSTNTRSKRPSRYGWKIKCAYTVIRSIVLSANVLVKL